MYIQHPENKHTSLYIYTTTTTNSNDINILLFKHIYTHDLWADTWHKGSKASSPTGVALSMYTQDFVYIHILKEMCWTFFKYLHALFLHIYIYTYISTYTCLWGKITLVWCIIHTHVYIYIHQCVHYTYIYTRIYLYI